MKSINIKFTLLTLILISYQAFGQIQTSFYDTTFQTRYNSLDDEQIRVVENRRAGYFFNENIKSSFDLATVSSYANTKFTRDPYVTKISNILDAEAKFNFPTFGGSRATSTRLGSSKNPFLLAVFTQIDFEVRILNNDKKLGDSSLPVRTPSYKAGAELFFTWKNLYDYNRTNNYAYSIKGYHHSDGMQGEYFFNKKDEPWGKKGYYDTHWGEFSDDWCFEFYLHYNNSPKHPIYKRNLFMNINAKVGFKTSTTITDSLQKYNVYGKYKFNLSSNFIFYHKYHFSLRNNNGISKFSTNENDFTQITRPYQIEFFRVEANASYITQTDYYTGPLYNLKPVKFFDAGKRLNIWAAIHFRIPSSSMASVFVKFGYIGSDEYNCHFQQSYAFIKAGLSIGNLFYYNKSDDLN